MYQMASDDVALDSDSALSDQPAQQKEMCKLRQKTKKRVGCYFYVNADSAEADTLKDRFWRDLDQGKIAFDRTEDLYTRVKRGATKTPSTLHLNISRSHDATSSQDSAGTDNVSVGCLGEVSFLSGSSAVIDASTPASSGYDSSSIPSVGPVTAANSPGDTTMSHSLVSNPVDIRLEVQEVEDSDCGLNERSHVRKKKHSSSESRKVFHKSRREQKKFYELVDASSDAADTLKDKFWRDLEMGKVNVAACGDLYSAVKVSRNRRPQAVSLPNTNSSCETNKTMTTLESTAAIKTELLYSHSESSSCDKIEWNASNEVVDRTVSSTNSCENLELGVTDKSSSSYQRLSDDIIDNWLAVTDSKLQSPCAVAVERLSWTYSSVGDSANGLDKKCRLNLNVKHLNTCHKSNSPKLLRSRLAKRVYAGRPARSKRCKFTKRKKSVDTESETDTDWSTTLSNCEVLECSATESEQAEVLMTNNAVGAQDNDLLICIDPEKPCCSLLSAISWLSCENESTCVQSGGSLLDFIKRGDCSSVRLLMKHRSLPIGDLLQSSDCEGMTPLMMAAGLGHCDIIDVLIRCGANVDAQTSLGVTSLMIASEKGLRRVVDVLLKFGAQMEICSTLGETALMKAVRGGHSDVVELLLATGVNTTAVSKDRETACSIARRSQHLDYISGILDSHIIRRVNVLQDTIHSFLHGTVSVVDTLFPLHCFALNGRRQEFSVKFHFSQDLAPAGTHALLFIGHSIMGDENIDCWLQGPSSIAGVRLNGIELVPLGEREQFIFLCRPLQHINQLDLHIQSHRVESNVKLLVCAYFIQPSDTPCSTVACPLPSDDVCQIVTSQRSSDAVSAIVTCQQPNGNAYQAVVCPQSYESAYQTVGCRRPTEAVCHAISHEQLNEAVYETLACQPSKEAEYQTVTAQQYFKTEVDTVVCRQSMKTVTDHHHVALQQPCQIECQTVYSHNVELHNTRPS